VQVKKALRQARSIDVHAHAVLAESMHKAGEHGPEIGYTEDGEPWFRVGRYRLDGVRYEGSPFMDPELRLKRMDEAGIDFQVLSPNPLTYFHFIDAAPAISFCREHNNALQELVATSDRLAGFAALPMQDVGAACEELERAIADLGMLGAYIGTDFGRPLNDPEMDRLYEKLVTLDVPLFIHPAPAGIDGPPGDQNLRQFDLDLLTGFGAQESIAVASLVYGGVLHRHPQLDICLSHAGGGTLALIGRLNRACVKRPWVPEYLRHEGAFEEQLSRLWFDNHVHDTRILELVMDIMGEDRLVLGTNFAGWDQHALHIDADSMQRFTENARRLLRADD
jgi:aminocarboxymuconate-semialdehyde decarboxylase